MKLELIHHHHSVCLLVYHFVVCTYRRKKELTEDITVDLIKEAIKCYPLTIHAGEIMPDHIHLMIQTPATIAPSDIARIIKGCTWKHIKAKLGSFSGWSGSYFISTTGQAGADAVKAYIEHQKG